MCFNIIIGLQKFNQGQGTIEHQNKSVELHAVEKHVGRKISVRKTSVIGKSQLVKHSVRKSSVMENSIHSGYVDTQLAIIGKIRE